MCIFVSLQHEKSQLLITNIWLKLVSTVYTIGFFFLQDEKNQLLITNIWLKLVSIKILQAFIIS